MNLGGLIPVPSDRRTYGDVVLQLTGTPHGDRLALQYMGENRTLPEPTHELLRRYGDAWECWDVGTVYRMESERERLLDGGHGVADDYRVVPRVPVAS